MAYSKPKVIAGKVDVDVKLSFGCPEKASCWMSCQNKF